MPSIRYTPVSPATSINCRHSSGLTTSGFSQSTALPAAVAASIRSECVSVGVAISTASDPAFLPETVLDQADRALFSAKTRGRNTVTLDQSAAYCRKLEHAEEAMMKHLKRTELLCAAGLVLLLGAYNRGELGFNPIESILQRTSAAKTDQ